jgi:flavin-dependent dehydrogenase
LRSSCTLGLLQAVLASRAPAIRQVTFTAAGESVTRAVKHPHRGLHRPAPARRAGSGGTLAHRTAPHRAPVTGVLRSPNQLRRAHVPGWALVGDAGYHRDAVTGHGLSEAYRDAELLAFALHQALRNDTDERTALADDQHQRDQALREVFELTRALAAYPPVPEFVDLQKQLSRALDTEAAELAVRPVPGERELACA